MIIKPILHDSYDSVTVADIAAYESDIGAQLPGDYRQFLLWNNGGRYAHEVEWVSSQQGETVDEADVQGFYPLNDQLDESGLLKQYRDAQCYLPKKYQPIGWDGTGCRFCLMLEPGDGYGSVWWWNHNDTLENGLERLASSFQSFYNNIIYYPECEWEEEIPAFLACEQGDLERLHRLFQEGLDFGLRNKTGETLLMCAAENAQVHVSEYLLGKGIDIEAEDTYGRRAMQCAVISKECTSLLINAGAQIDVPDEEGWTPLLKAVEYRNYQVLQLLLAHGADVNVDAGDGFTPLYLCKQGIECMQEPILGILLRAGAKE